MERGSGAAPAPPPAPRQPPGRPLSPRPPAVHPLGLWLPLRPLDVPQQTPSHLTPLAHLSLPLTCGCRRAAQISPSSQFPSKLSQYWSGCAAGRAGPTGGQSTAGMSCHCSTEAEKLQGLVPAETCPQKGESLAQSHRQDLGTKPGGLISPSPVLSTRPCSPRCHCSETAASDYR